MVRAIYLSLIAAFFAGLSANDLTCQLCIDVVSAIEDFLTDGATQDDIIAWVEQYCEELDSQILQNTCKRMIEDHLPDIIDALVNGFPPQTVCVKIGMCNGTISTTTPLPDVQWYYLMTELGGERVLRMMPDQHGVEMYGKGHSGQHWRIEPPNGCIRNKELSGQCLAIEGAKQGALVYMHEETGSDEQNWKYKDKYLESKVRNDEIIKKGYLCLDVVWADVDLITDGAAVHGWHEDNTVSQKWNIIPVDDKDMD